MTNHAIPEAAVEAAADALCRAVWGTPWDMAIESQRGAFRAQATEALEAAAPHMTGGRMAANPRTKPLQYRDVIPEAAKNAAFGALSAAMGYKPSLYRREFGKALVLALEAAAPHMLADILEASTNAAKTDELSTAAEVIYDLRNRAKEIRPA